MVKSRCSAPIGTETWRQSSAVRLGDKASNIHQLVFPHGTSVERDVDAAFRWISAAAERGKAEAQTVLGTCTARGSAARRTSRRRSNGIGRGRTEVRSPPNSRLATSTIKAKAFLSISSMQRSGIARQPNKIMSGRKLRLAFMNLKGTGMPEAPAEAARLFQGAARHDDTIALYNIGLLRLNGHGIAKDVDQAETALRKAARKDYFPAIQALAEFYSHGAGSEPDLREAAVWYEKAAERGDVQAQFFMGRFYATGIGIGPNIRQAARWFERAAEEWPRDRRVQYRHLLSQRLWRRTQCEGRNRMVRTRFRRRHQGRAGATREALFSR